MHVLFFSPPLLLFAISVALTHTHTHTHTRTHAHSFSLAVSLSLSLSLSRSRCRKTPNNYWSCAGRAARRGYSHPRALSQRRRFEKGEEEFTGRTDYLSFFWLLNVTLKNGTRSAIQMHFFMFQESRTTWSELLFWAGKNEIIKDYISQG